MQLVVGQEISFTRIQGGHDLGINQWPCPGKIKALSLSCQSFLYHFTMSKVTAPQDAHNRLVLQVYLGSNTLEFSAIRK